MAQSAVKVGKLVLPSMINTGLKVQRKDKRESVYVKYINTVKWNIFALPNFRDFASKHEDKYSRFLIFAVVYSSENCNCNCPDFLHTYFRDNSKPVGIVSNNIAVTMFKQLHN